METTSPSREKILQSLLSKSQIKQKVYDNTFEVFQNIKDVLHELAGEINDEISEVDKRVKSEYRDRGQYEAELRVAEDILIFSMHSNVFQFDRNHAIWNNPYIAQEDTNSYCGMINIYNFLTDSLKYNRLDDLGYLIGRIFINKENHYFVEGKGQLNVGHGNFGVEKLARENITKIIESAIQHSLNFDLLVPPYDMVKIVSVAQINNKVDDAQIQTGKRLGFQFDFDSTGKE